MTSHGKKRPKSLKSKFLVAQLLSSCVEKANFKVSTVNSLEQPQELISRGLVHFSSNEGYKVGLQSNNFASKYGRSEFVSKGSFSKLGFWNYELQNSERIWNFWWFFGPNSSNSISLCSSIDRSPSNLWIKVLCSVSSYILTEFTCAKLRGHNFSSSITCAKPPCNPKSTAK